jgi:tetratricopeptide (TPR) repeat protein
VSPPPAAAASPTPKPTDPFLAARQLVLDGRYPEGIAALQAFGFDDHPDVATYLGLANRRLGRIDAAKAWYAKALSADPDHIVTLLHAGTLLAELGDAAGARRHLARIEALCRGCPEQRQLEQAIAAATR